jgi:putative aldouronate transport system permease protein
MLAPVLGFFILFKYVPMAGVLMAFQDYNIIGGIFKSPWAGLRFFNEMFNSPAFFRVLGNTLIINFWKYLTYTPAPLILAIMINEVRHAGLKKTVQTITYFPNFISWIIVFGILMNLLNMQDGLINQAISALGGKPVPFMISKKHFVGILVVSDIWKYVGIDSIIYLSALTAIDPQLYESAVMDGAGKMRRIFSITLPCISNTFFIMVILSLGRVLDAGHEQIIALYSQPVFDVADVLSTYTYRVGVSSMRYSYSSAVGLFSSVISLIMITVSNWLSRKYSETSIW